jgi:hypothetical protein
LLRAVVACGVVLDDFIMIIADVIASIATVFIILVHVCSAVQKNNNLTNKLISFIRYSWAVSSVRQTHIKYEYMQRGWFWYSRRRGIGGRTHIPGTFLLFIQ